MKKIDSAIEQTILNLYKEHKNIGIVSQKTGKTRTTISRVIKRNNLLIEIKTGDKRPNWKGEGASYSTKHDWIKRWKAKPKECEWCGQEKKLEAHNLDGKYRRILEEWVWICRKCHINGDGRVKNNLRQNRRLIVKHDLNQLSIIL